MTPLASLERLIKTDEPEVFADSLCLTVEAMLVTARLALDNETSGSELRDRAGFAVEEMLSVTQALMCVVSEGVENLQRKQRRKDAA